VALTDGFIVSLLPGNQSGHSYKNTAINMKLSDILHYFPWKFWCSFFWLM